jgi:hypothetical protein
MTISRLTIDKLGIKLYDKVSAVLAELIANAYDADATEVTITLPAFGRYLATKFDGLVEDAGLEIVVEDNGHGMTYDEVMDYYLKVGTDRRRRPRGGAFSRDKSRPVMGRKGIGKLAPFGICKQIEVLTAGGDPEENDRRYSNFILDYDGIMGEITDEDYPPQPGDFDQDPANHRGTKITLRDFGYRKVPDRGTLVRQLTARFGLDRADWRVRIVDASGQEPPIDLSGSELDVEVLESTRVNVDDRPVLMGDGTTLPVSGWIAYAKEPYKDDVMAGVRIYARGKIVSQTRDFNVPTGFHGEFKLRSYLTGYVTAEWLDDDTGEDLIRSDRQDILWSSERGEALQVWGQAVIKEIAGRAEGSVRTTLWEEFKTLSDIDAMVRAAFPKDAELRESAMQVARIAIRGADGDAIRDPDFRAGAIDFALSVAPHKVLVQSIHDLAHDESRTFATLVTLFRRERLAELYAVGTAAKRRVEALEKLRQMLGSDVEEKSLQGLLEEAPWIVSPEWEVLLADRSLEIFRRNFEDWYKKTYDRDIVTTAIDRPTKEPDFIFIQTRQKLRIVEIKRPNIRLSDEEFRRAAGYLAAVKKFVRENPVLGYEQKHIALVIIVDGLRLKDPTYEEAIQRPPITRYTWRQVWDRAMNSNVDLVDAFESARKPMIAITDPGDADKAM